MFPFLNVTSVFWSVQRHFGNDADRALVLEELESTEIKETRSNFEQAGLEKYFFEHLEEKR